MSISPDAVPLIDLTLLDVTPQDLIEQALADATTKLPGWVPREGNTEVVLLEAQALAAAETIYAVNRIPAALLNAVLTLYGLTRDPGAAPSATFTFTTSAVGDVTIPAGTRVRIAYASGTAYLDFLTDVDLLIAGGSGSGTVAATAEVPTSVLNGTPAGPAELVDALVYIDSVASATEVLGGVDPETLDGYQARGAVLLSRLVSTLVLPEHFTAAALEDTAVERAATYDLFNAALGTGAPGDHPGHVTVAVAGTAGTALAGATKTALNADLEAKAHAAIVVHVIDATVTNVNVTATVVTTPGADPAVVALAVEAALDDYLNPDLWPFAATVYRNELIALIDRVDGVARVDTLTAPAADVTLTGVAPLARAGVVTITAA